MNILVTGSNGQLGSELQFLAVQFPQFKFIFVDVADLDITDAKAVTRFFNQHNIHFCINCAAYTAVDKAETDIALCRKINATGAANLAKACANIQAMLVHISTDYVYHNRQNTPFKEGDTTSPKGMYAKTKLEGDLKVLKINPLTIVLRTSWVYSTFGHNFVKTMLRYGKERPEMRVVFDQIGTPTYARDLAQAILEILAKVESKEVAIAAAQGVFHYSNEGVTSWYDFAHAIFEIAQINCKVIPIETAAYPTPAKRPPFSVLNKGKIKAVFGIEIPHWKDSLKKCMENL
jgi:dTDP-4-dehydrorhamnose reductase